MGVWRAFVAGFSLGLQACYAALRFSPHHATVHCYRTSYIHGNKSQKLLCCHLNRQSPDQQPQPAPQTRDCLCAALPVSQRKIRQRWQCSAGKLKGLQLIPNADYLELCTEVQLRFAGAADCISWPSSHVRRVEAGAEKKKEQRKMVRHARRRPRFRMQGFEC